MRRYRVPRDMACAGPVAIEDPEGIFCYYVEVRDLIKEMDALRVELERLKGEL